ncbi:MAG: hypothetical protein HUU54_00795 [Ignavibacteriaceae bacterium]|nr:hypothetical protein [Ignavibacteriaceae bacterium]
MKQVYYIIFLIFIIAGFSDAQFISNKGKNEGKYLNYSGRNYENYSSAFIKKKFFDNFGNFLVEGTTVYELGETQKQLSSAEFAGGTSDIIKSRYYQNYFNNLVIGKDSYGGFQTRLMVGDAIRTKFTNLTLNRARFNGIRWDMGTSKLRGTLLASRISDPIRFRFDAGIYIDGVRRIRDWTQYLFGGHFETDIGDVLTVGLTYVNQHQRKTSLDSKEASLEGVVTTAIPRVIFVRITDDSPGDNSGPIIFGAPRVIINGNAIPTVNIHKKLPSEASTSLMNPTNPTQFNPIQYWILRDVERQKGFQIDQRFFGGADTTSFSSHQYYSNSSKYSIPPPLYPVQVPSSIDEGYVYAFLMPEGVKSVQFQIILANDYKIETANDYVNWQLDDYTGDARFNKHHVESTIGFPTPFFVRERADGNVRDASNKRVVTVNYGLASGMSVYGLNFDFKWQGFEISGEFNESVEFMKYPLLSGNRFESKGKAWFLKGKKKIGRMTLGGERYQIDPRYTTWLNTYVLENSYFQFNSTSAVPSTWLPSTLTPPDYTEYDASFTYQRRVFFPGGAFYPLVDDNDDDDRWEDGFYFYNVRPTDVNQRNRDVLNPAGGDFFKLGYRQSTYELRSLDAITRQPDAGIFPGKDKDNDGIPDDDKNADGVPDFAQDFLTYYSDPPSLDYGDDWNNNSVIDEQENDIHPDYPYEPDIDGYHLFTNLELLDGLNVAVGKIYEEAIARGGSNDVNYFKANYFTGTPRFGELRLYYVLKQVKDNIENHGYQFKGVITASDPIPDFVEDPLNYRNSLVNSVYFGTRYTQIKNLNIENIFRVEYNNQYKSGSRSNAFLPESKKLGDQVPGNIVFWGIVNKIDYTFYLLNGQLKLSPQFKVRTQKIVLRSEDQQGNPTLKVDKHDQEIIPIFRVDYRLTDNTDIRLGFQGLDVGDGSDLFYYKIRNLKDNFESQNRATYGLSLSNRTSFNGYNVVFDFGYKYTTIDFLRPADQSKGSAESTIFFTVFAGF